MSEINIKARIRKNMLDSLAGECFRDERSEIVQQLTSKGKDALVGIEREDCIYTIIGYDKIYFSTTPGSLGEIDIRDMLTILQENALSKGKSATYEFVKINDLESIWVKDIKTMNALWNTMLLLDNPHCP
jgi:hypothetical protein